MRRSADPRQHARARELRKSMGVSEKVLWNWLRRDRLGARFLRQVPIGPYILDFYCPAAKLCVEVDGEQHAAQREYDAKRDEYLMSQGIETVRVPSLDLFRDEPGLDPVRDVARAVERRLADGERSKREHSTPQPPPHPQADEEGEL